MIIIDDRRPVWTVTIASEARRNALTRQMVAELLEALEQFERDTAARAMTITGAGSVAFCAGADLKEMAAETDAVFVPVLPRVYERIIGCGKPVVAMLNGDAVGGGFELALACDLIVARRGVRVGLPEVGLGTVARYGAALLARQIGPQPAQRLALLGQLHTIEDVSGVAARIVDADELVSATRDITQRLAELPARSLTATKQIVRLSAETALSELVTLPAVLAAVQSADRRRAVSAFDQERTKPAS